MSSIKVTVFDEHLQIPVSNISLYLEKAVENDEFIILSRSFTDRHGKCINLIHSGYSLTGGLYRLNLDLRGTFLYEDPKRFLPPYVPVFLWVYPQIEIKVALTIKEIGYHVQID